MRSSLSDPDSPSTLNPQGVTVSPILTERAVAHVLNPSIGWWVYATEYPWQTLDGDSQFLDIVAQNEVMYLCIECKKTRKEALVFLRPLGQLNTGSVLPFRCLRATPIRELKERLELFCENWDMNPASTESEFCVVSTSESGRDQRMLERDASFVVRATEAFAHDFRERFKTGDPLSSTCLFLPIVVTNAPIYTARYRPIEVSLETGEFLQPAHEIERVSWVRFRKAFTSESGPDLGDRSVFVIEASSLIEFLKGLKAVFVQPEN